MYIRCNRGVRQPPKGSLVIVPQTSEEGWANFLHGLPPWQPSSEPLLLIAPHPDDEILGVGGLLATQCALGRSVSVVAVTDGERAYPDDPQSNQLGTLRVSEQTAALARVGVAADKITRLRLPDSAVSAHIDELISRLSLIASGETHIVAPWRGDFHPDHEACGIAAEQLARKTGAKLTSYFFWTWHHATPNLLADLPLRAFALSPQALRAKTEALLCHRSQLERVQGEPILPQLLLPPARRSFEVFLVS